MAISLKENDAHKMAVILSWPQCVNTNEMLLECVISGAMFSHIKSQIYTWQRQKNLHQQWFTDQIKLKQFFKMAVIPSWSQRVDADADHHPCWVSFHCWISTGSIRQCRLTGTRIPLVKTRQSHDRLISTTKIPTCGKAIPIPIQGLVICKDCVYIW